MSPGAEEDSGYVEESVEPGARASPAISNHCSLLATGVCICPASVDALAMKPGLFPVLVPHGSMWPVTGSSCPLLRQFSPPQVSLWTPYPGSPPTSGWRLLCSRSRFEAHRAQALGTLGVSGTHQRHPQFIDRNLDVF